jgi:hypothetical protein
MSLKFNIKAHAPAPPPVQAPVEEIQVQPFEEEELEAVPVPIVEDEGVEVTPDSFLNGICTALLIVIDEQKDITADQVIDFFKQNMIDNGLTLITNSDLASMKSTSIANPKNGSKRTSSEKQKANQSTFTQGTKERSLAWAQADKEYWNGIAKKIESKTKLSGWHVYQMFGGDQGRVPSPNPETGLIPRPSK